MNLSTLMVSCYSCLSQLESDDRHIAAVQTLRTAFTKVNKLTVLIRYFVRCFKVFFTNTNWPHLAYIIR